MPPSDVTIGYSEAEERHEDVEVPPVPSPQSAGKLVVSRNWSVRSHSRSPARFVLNTIDCQTDFWRGTAPVRVSGVPALHVLNSVPLMPSQSSMPVPQPTT